MQNSSDPHSEHGRSAASKSKKVIYWIATGFLIFALSWSVITYHLLYEQQSGFFEAFGYPTYLVIPLAWLKVVALVVIVTHRYNDLRDMVYAAYFLNMTVALVGHLILGDIWGHAALGMIALPVSYLLGNQVRGRPARNFFGKWTDPENA